ncbi:post-GPI attachment to proteins factor 6 [Tribolium castaneum]|uniref:Transmembrane protein 8A-like Protein n=1 Tax=Tribolium castaneum TaxID=7070 RepID=D6WPY8_TRICA|nr:PREDICTED: transmembrane protein 8A [Tribolium castaneum]EFA06895.2 Transmembrane protein 8A-like Protein [Tribolium castaneum]|eukprot:XP_973474.1 PREDICTED: transmembrane protein 8A [Tribolium castaneum]
MKWIILILLYPTIQCQEDENLEIVSKTRTSYLQKYGGYVDVVVMHVEVPPEVSFASLKFTADETKASIFGCKPRKVLLYMKHKSLPVINPDGSKFPDSFKNISRSQYLYLELMSDKSVKYLNLTSPDPGCYFITAFLPYNNPKHESIQPPELTPECYAFVETTLYIRRRPSAGQIVEGASYNVETFTSHSILYTFFVPEFVTHATFLVDNITFAKTATRLVIRIQSRSIPSENNTIRTEIIEPSYTNKVTIPFNTEEDNWHYIEFLFEGPASPTESKSSLKFTLKYFAEDSERTSNNSVWRIFNSDQITKVTKYKQYDLVRESSTESFSYSYELRQKFTISSNVAVNLTNKELAVLQFKLREHADIGGTLQFILAFKPRINKSKRIIEDEPADNKIIACIRPEAPELPTWPNLCNYDDNNIVAPLVLGKSTDNSSMMIPYPESGVWYATFKLFCGECVPCSCPNDCQKKFKACVKECQANCVKKETCNNCSLDCKTEVVNSNGCAKCDCDGPCLRSKKECNSSVLFDISSTACANNCGKHGRCMFMVCDGVVYATCVCTDNYRGWDCSDASEATPYYMIVIELLLLVLSNLMFLPTVYVAYRRKYYVEAIVYFAICFFSTFYHACDAGENVISFCITRLGALQFADFYCALLAIWVTLIAIADLPSYWPTMCHITGAIILSFTTTINKTGIWGFLLPVISGLVIIAINWFLKWKRVKRLFLHKRYLYVFIPLGMLVVCVGLTIFIFLETSNNYKYLHSLWHVLMAVGVMILLPQPNTFQPETVL